MDDVTFSEPRYRPDLNQGLGGTIELADDYVFPVELPARKVRSVLEEQAGEDTTVRGSQCPFFSLDIGDGKQYDLLYSHGEDEPIDAIALYAADTEETVEFYDTDELTE